MSSNIHNIPTLLNIFLMKYLKGLKPQKYNFVHHTRKFTTHTQMTMHLFFNLTSRLPEVEGRRFLFIITQNSL